MRNLIISLFFVLILPLVLYSEFKIIGCSDYLPYANDKVIVVFNQMVDKNSVPIENFVLSNENAKLNPISVEVENNIIDLKFNYIFKEGETNFLIFKNVKSQTGEYLLGISRNINFTAIDFTNAVSYILSCFLDDGAVITKKASSGDSISIVPYYSEFACFGLLRGYELTLNPVYLNKVKTFLQWYISHINSDGTIYDYAGTYPSYSSTGDMDSTDSYAAYFLLLVWKYYKYSQDKSFILQNFDKIKKVKNAINLTLDTSDYLTYAKPGYNAKYFMDNTEVYLGLKAYVNLLKLMNDKSELDEIYTHLNNNRNSLNNFYSQDYNAYAISKDNSGDFWFLTDGAYPYAMAQNFALYYWLDTDDELFAKIWATIKSKLFVDGIIQESSLAGKFWWLLNAKKINDENILKQIIVKFKNELINSPASYEMAEYILGIYGDIMMPEDYEATTEKELINTVTYPNPVEIGTHKTVKIKLSNFSLIDKIEIYDMAGNKIYEKSNIKEKIYEWNLKDYANNIVPSGAYLYILENNEDKRWTGKIIVIK